MTVIKYTHPTLCSNVPRGLQSRTMAWKLACLMVFLSALVSCSKKDQPAPGSVAVVHTNVSYGNDPLQKMDVYLPAGRSEVSTPLLIMLHGGAWISGDKSDFTPYVDSIQKILPDYAVANVNYRLASIGSNLFPTQEMDVDSAMQFLLRHTNEYEVSPDKIIYMGVSAGGQLALLEAYKYASPRAAAVISFFGPTDMADLALNSPDTAIIDYLPLLMGGTPAQNPGLYFRSSPVHFVNSTTCPTLLLQGGRDPLVPFAEAYELSDTLQAHGVIHQMVFYPGDGHGWTGPDLADSFQKILTFLQANIH